MWPRIFELLIAFWLILSHFLLRYDGIADFTAAVLVAFFALLALFERFAKAHLLQIIPIGILFYVSYSYPSYELPFALQNFIVTALTLLFFFILPTDACSPPKQWREFLKQFDSKGK